MARSYWPELTNDLANALKNSDRYDVVIIAGQEPECAKLQAHSVILCARCSYFNKAFSSNWEMKDDHGHYIFHKTNISVPVFQLILQYLYTGNIEFHRHSKNILLNCLIAADELGLDQLIGHIQDYIMVECPNVLLDDPVAVLEAVYKTESLKCLTERCLEAISAEPTILFVSERFPFLDKTLITRLLERDDLNMTEADIWDLLLRWAYVHYLKIGRDHSSIGPEELQSVEQIVKEHIPMIDFYKMTKEDFDMKVYPYKGLLPVDLLQNIMLYYKESPCTMIQNRRCRRDHNANSKDQYLSPPAQLTNASFHTPAFITQTSVVRPSRIYPTFQAPNRVATPFPILFPMTFN